VPKSFSEGKTSGQRLGEKRQALVHPVIDTGVVVGKLLIATRNAKLVQPPQEPTGTVRTLVQEPHILGDPVRALLGVGDVVQAIEEGLTR
jgi:hypothetical protein